MFKASVREGVAVVMCLCLICSQTVGGWDVGILRAANKVVEDTPQPEPHPQKENKPPTISKIMDRTIAKGGMATVTFLVNDAETTTGLMVVARFNGGGHLRPTGPVAGGAVGNRGGRQPMDINRAAPGGQRG
jgi:hypothetical protein